MAARDGIWSRGGMPVEELPDLFASEPLPSRDQAQPAEPQQEPPPPRKRRRWPIDLYSIAALIFVTFIWLVLTAPLSRALEPLQDPAPLMLSDHGRPIALRGSVKEPPVDIPKLNRLDPASGGGAEAQPTGAARDGRYRHDQPGAGAIDGPRRAGRAIGEISDWNLFR